MNVERRIVAADPQTKPNDLRFELPKDCFHLYSPSSFTVYTDFGPNIDDKALGPCLYMGHATQLYFNSQSQHIAQLVVEPHADCCCHGTYQL